MSLLSSSLMHFLKLAVQVRPAVAAQSPEGEVTADGRWSIVASTPTIKVVLTLSR